MRKRWGMRVIAATMAASLAAGGPAASAAEAMSVQETRAEETDAIAEEELSDEAAEIAEEDANILFAAAEAESDLTVGEDDDILMDDAAVFDDIDAVDAGLFGDTGAEDADLLILDETSDDEASADGLDGFDLAEMSEDMPEGILAEMSDDMPEGILAEMPDDTPEGILTEMPDDTPEGILTDVPDDTPEGILAEDTDNDFAEAEDEILAADSEFAEDTEIIAVDEVSAADQDIFEEAADQEIFEEAADQGIDVTADDGHDLVGDYEEELVFPDSVEEQEEDGYSLENGSVPPPPNTAGITVGTGTLVRPGESGIGVYNLLFTPQESGTYEFYSDEMPSGTRAALYVYQSSISVKDQPDILTENSFSLKADLEKGVRYRLAICGDTPFYVYLSKGDARFQASMTVSKTMLSPGETVRMTVNTNADAGVTYQWYEEVYVHSRELPGENGPTLERMPDVEEVTYTCIVTGPEGTKVSLHQTVYVRNNLSAAVANGGDFGYCETEYYHDKMHAYATDGYVQLEVDVSATDMSGMTYVWKGFDEYAQTEFKNVRGTVDPATGRVSLTVPVKNGSMNLTVTDRLEDTATVRFVMHTEHDWSELERLVEPTYCTEGKARRICLSCHKEETGSVPVLAPVAGVPVHDTEIIPAVAATCEKDGKTQGERCRLCGTVVTAQKTVKAAHKFSVWKKVSATANSQSEKQQRTCSVCGMTETRGLVNWNHDDIVPKPNPIPQKDKTDKKTETGSTTDKKSVEYLEEKIKKSGKDASLEGAAYGTLKVQTSRVTKNAIKIKWSPVKGADGYLVYGAESGKTMKRLADVSADTSAYTQKRLSGGTSYKYMVAAYKTQSNGTRRQLAYSTTIVAATSGGKTGNVSAVKVTKKSVSLKAKKKYSIRATAKAPKKSRVKTNRTLSYESSNKKIATVSKKGVITAKKKGTCYIYVYARNGIAAKVKVKVK